MSRSFFLLFFASFTGVLITSISGNDASLHHWFGLAFGLIPICIYHFLLYKKPILSSGEVDSIYYFGFLVTIITLVSTAIAIGVADKLPSIKWILLQFGLGLVATGYALFARLHLIAQSSGQVEMNIVEASQRLADSVTSVSNQFDHASFQVTAFVNQLEGRLENIAKNNETKMEESLVNSLNEFEEASQNLIKKYMSQSLSAVDGATRSFAFSVNNVITEIDRIKSEAENISFTDAADEIKNFSKEIKKSFSDITEETALSSSTAADAVSRLTSTLRKVQRLADEIVEKLHALDNLGIILSEVERAAQGLSDLSEKSSFAALSLEDLQTQSQQAAQDITNSLIKPLATEAASDGLITLTRTLPVDASKLLLNVTELNERFSELKNSVKESEIMISAGRDALKVPSDLQPNYTNFADALATISTELGSLRNSFSELQVVIATSRTSLASVDMGEIILNEKQLNK